MNIKINNSKHTSLTSTRNVNFSNQKPSKRDTSKEPTYRDHVVSESRTANTTALKSVFNQTSVIRAANSTVNITNQTKYKNKTLNKDLAVGKFEQQCLKQPQQKLNIDLNPKMIQEFSKNSIVKQESVQRKKMINFEKIVEYESASRSGSIIKQYKHNRFESIDRSV